MLLLLWGLHAVGVQTPDGTDAGEGDNRRSDGWTSPCLSCCPSGMARTSIQGHNQKFIPRPFRPFPLLLFPPFHLPLFFSRLEVAPQIQLEICGSAVSSSSGNNNFAANRHVFRALNTPKKCVCGRAPTADAFMVYLEPGKESGCCRSISVRLTLKNWSKCGCFWMYCILPCSWLLSSTWLFSTFYFGDILPPKPLG